MRETRMMLKLYRRDGGVIRYWEAWDDGKRQVLIHEGTVGDQGSSHTQRIPRGSKASDVIEQASRRPRSQGYEVIPDEAHAEMIVQFAVEGWGGPKDLDFRVTVEDLLNETLGWTGNGHCDGGDIGSGTINVFSFVVEPPAAVDAVRTAFAERNWLDRAVIAIRNDDHYDIVWPPGHAGPFRL